MSKAAQEPHRPLTRSMASTTRRRSARVGSSRGKQRTQPSVLLDQSELGSVRHATGKRKRPPVLVERSRDTRSRKECEQISTQAEPRLQPTDARQNAVRDASSVQTAKDPACTRRSRVKDLEQRLDSALQAKQELAAQLHHYKANAIQLTLKHLEEYFTCPLCFEILACPYTMTPRNCGHTFCVTCLLRWFFSRLHKGCGGWHEAVDCPLCRGALPHTPERTPRPASSFPFTPNRTADTAIQGLINSIVHNLGTAGVVDAASLSDWHGDGHTRQEWSKRERAGRTEMTSIAAQWNTLKPTDFVNIKIRLEV